MGTDLNRLSFEANPPLVVVPRHQLMRRIGPMLLEGVLAVPQMDSGQGLRSIQYNKETVSFGRSINSTPTIVEVWHASLARSSSATPSKGREGTWDVLESLAGLTDAPADWSVEHDHYLYGTPKRR
jgi:hypothetical protein